MDPTVEPMGTSILGIQGPFPISQETDDPYDALADLFLNDTVPGPEANRPDQPQLHEQDAPSVTTQVVHRPQICGLLLGHLPVLASAWVWQYAREMALDEPVAMLRISQQHASLDLIGKMPAEVSGTARSIVDAIKQASTITRRWLIRVDEGDEHEMIASLGAQESDAKLTILTGASETAIVGAYQTLKRLMSSAPCVRSSDITLAIMGVPAEKADHAGSRIQQAAESFLGRKIDLMLCDARITGGPSLALYRGPSDLSVFAALRLVQDTAQRGEIPAECHIDLPAVTPEEVYYEANLQPQYESDASIESDGSFFTEACDEPSYSATTYDQSESELRQDADDLSSLVDGLSLVDGRCPFASDIEMALDNKGRVHALCLVDSDPSAALAQLMIVQGWLRHHAPLLGSSVNDAEAVLHLFTSEPALVRRFSDVPGLRLHVRVEPSQRTVCLDLN